MVKKKNIGMAILLSVFTCGIYSLYWFFSLVENTNELSGEVEPSGGMVVLLSIVTCGIYMHIWFYNVGRKLTTIQERSGLPVKDNSILYLLLSIFGMGIVSFALIQSEINKLAVDSNEI